MDRRIIKKKILSLFKEALSEQPIVPVEKNPYGHTLPKPLNPLKELGGGLADGKTLKDIAKHHGVSLSDITSQVEKGKDVEAEHTDDSKVATDISKDHNWESPTYYDDLKAAGIDEEKLNEMPYFFDIPNSSGQPLDLQLEKWNSEEEFKQFLIQLFSGESYTDMKQPKIQLGDAEAFIKNLTNFSSDLNDPATQFLVQFIRKFRANGRKVNLKTITPDDVNYLKRFVADAYNRSKENIV